MSKLPYHVVMGEKGARAGAARGEHGVDDGARNRGHRFHRVKMVGRHRAGVERQKAEPQHEGPEPP